MFSSESPHTIFNIKNITLNYPKSAVMEFFPKRLKNEFETAVVNELSAFDSLEVYCHDLNGRPLLLNNFN